MLPTGRVQAYKVLVLMSKQLVKDLTIMALSEC